MAWHKRRPHHSMSARLVYILGLLSSASAAPGGSPHLGKSTYAMSHPFAWKAFMEKYFPTAENKIEQNSTTDCVEW